MRSRLTTTRCARWPIGFRHAQSVALAFGHAGAFGHFGAGQRPKSDLAVIFAFGSVSAATVELLQQLKQFNSQGARTDKLQDGAVQKLTQADAAERAEMSERRSKTAIRVANIPEPEFEAAVESPEPPTVTALAEAGTKKRAPIGFPGGPEAPPGFAEATQAIGTLKRFAEFCRDHDAVFVAGGVLRRAAGKVSGRLLGRLFR